MRTLNIFKKLVYHSMTGFMYSFEQVFTAEKQKVSGQLPLLHFDATGRLVRRPNKEKTIKKILHMFSQMTGYVLCSISYQFPLS